MKHQEGIARGIVLIGLALLVVPLIAGRGGAARDLHARVAESGGWTPDAIRIAAGQPLHLRLTSDDVVHGFAVGRMEGEPVDVLPGQVTELTLTFDQPGTYTFYCTRWCGVNHWRMRGTIEVEGEPAAPEPDSVPLYVTLGLDLDAPHPAQVQPEGPPNAERGRDLARGFPLSQFFALDYYRSHSPAQTFSDLRAEPSLESLTDAQVWDVVAHVWASQAPPEDLTEGRRLYAQNCAACHGETGAGDGVFADDLAAAGQASAQSMSGMADMSMQPPADFSDPERLLGASPALLQGKLLRGGMGTGMPMWGVIFSDEQTWQIVAYLYTFQFEEQPE